MSKVAPALCSSYKGVLPSDLLDKYTEKGGMNRLEYDLACLNTIHEQIQESQSSSNDGASMEARRKQRRQQRETISDSDAIALLKQRGIPTKE